MVENFVTQLMAGSSEEEGGKITFSTDHLNNCLQQLSTNIMAREKHSFERFISILCVLYRI